MVALANNWGMSYNMFICIGGVNRVHYGVDYPRKELTWPSKLSKSVKPIFPR